MTAPSSDLTGSVFGWLTVVKRAGRAPNGSSTQSAWLCRCGCGKHKTVPRQLLVTGKTTSCGCKEIRRIAARKRKVGFYTPRRAEIEDLDF